MYKTLEEFYDGASQIIINFNRFIAKNGLNGLVVADHICYKVSSSVNFDHMRAVLELESSWLQQAIISGRRIATFRVKNSVYTTAGNIGLIELADQKPFGLQEDRFDHIEIVPTKESYEQVLTRLKNNGVEIREAVRPHHNTHDMDIGDGFNVKLSRYSLADKIREYIV